MTDKEIKSKAFEWATDYKPWETDLTPQEYAMYGYEIGYKHAVEQEKYGHNKPGSL
jgi:hypothetical protein